MKNWWGRCRPFEVIGQSGKYTPWYQINGNNGHTSFPSGHTRFSWLFLYLPLLLRRNQFKMQRALTIITIFMGIGGSLGRVRLANHWLTDVAVSSFITVVIIYLASRILQTHFIEKETL